MLLLIYLLLIFQKSVPCDSQSGDEFIEIEDMDWSNDDEQVMHAITNCDPAIPETCVLPVAVPVLPTTTPAKCTMDTKHRVSADNTPVAVKDKVIITSKCSWRAASPRFNPYTTVASFEHAVVNTTTVSSAKLSSLGRCSLINSIAGQNKPLKVLTRGSPTITDFSNDSSKRTGGVICEATTTQNIRGSSSVAACPKSKRVILHTNCAPLRKTANTTKANSNEPDSTSDAAVPIKRNSQGVSTRPLLRQSGSFSESSSSTGSLGCHASSGNSVTAKVPKMTKFKFQKIEVKPVISSISENQADSITKTNNSSGNVKYNFVRKSVAVQQMTQKLGKVNSFNNSAIQRPSDGNFTKEFVASSSNMLNSENMVVKESSISSNLHPFFRKYENSYARKNTTTANTMPRSILKEANTQSIDSAQSHRGNPCDPPQRYASLTASSASLNSMEYMALPEPVTFTRDTMQRGFTSHGAGRV